MIIDKIKKLLKSNRFLDEDELTEPGSCDICYTLSSSIKNWPSIEGEPLDCENSEIISISDNEIVICCGGDWQDPQTLTISLVNSELTVINSIDGYKDGMSNAEIEKTFGQ